MASGPAAFPANEVYGFPAALNNKIRSGAACSFAPVATPCVDSLNCGGGAAQLRCPKLTKSNNTIAATNLLVRWTIAAV